MQIVNETRLSERTVRKRLKNLVDEKKVIRRTGGYRIGNITYGSPEIVKVPIQWDEKLITVPTADLERPSRWNRAKEEVRDHYRGSLAGSIHHIMYGKDLPQLLRRPYYVTAERLLPKPIPSQK